MLSYPVRLIPEDDEGVRLVFPDVPEAAIVGATEDEAFGKAKAELEKALAAYVADGRSIPAPSDICGAPSVGTDRFRIEGIA